MFQDIRFSARDGALLYARRYASRMRSPRALVCLPGLVGNSAQFDRLARTIAQSQGTARDVYTIDLRGRGQSELGPSRQAPSLLTESEDVLDFMTMAGLRQAAILGTGHGGQLGIVMAMLRPSAVGAIIFNDSGPEFEMEGLVRLMGQIANVPVPASWTDAQLMLKHLQGRQYPRLTDDEWLDVAKSNYLERDGKPARSYDRAIAMSYSLTRGTAYRQTMWPQFEAMAHVPVLVLRGELSDVISLATVARMREIHPRLEALKIPGQGHPPLLRDGQSVTAIQDFLARHDLSETAAEMPPMKAVA